MLSSDLPNFSETVGYIRKQVALQPVAGIVLGTGMGRLADRIAPVQVLGYNFIPHFPISTVESHFGRLIFGHLGGVPVVAMQGRFHYYEGYSQQQITYPIRILKLLGIHTLFISNAAGGINPGLRLGGLMVIDDHINLLPENPLRGANLDDLGPRFPDMSRPYDPDLQQTAHAIAQQKGTPLATGVYAAVPGPNLETRAEYRFLRALGADAVGMSTVPEVLVAAHMGLRTFAVSVITDECDPDNLHPVSLERIVEVAQAAEPKLTALLEALVVASCGPGASA